MWDCSYFEFYSLNSYDKAKWFTATLANYKDGEFEEDQRLLRNFCINLFSSYYTGGDLDKQKVGKIYFYTAVIRMGG